MNQRTIPAQRFKMLVDSVTEQIVWLSYMPGAIPPIVDPSLNYRSFIGHPSIDVYKEYEKFKLFYVPNTKSLVVKDQPFETTQEEERIKFLRYKCQVFDTLNGLFAFYSERIDLLNTVYLESVNSSLKDEWVGVYEDTYNCSKENAVKLLDFKINEYQKSNFIIKSAKLQMMESLKNAQTIDDLKFVFDTTNIKLFNVDSIPIFSQ
jgi:hypothetical protein